MRRFAEQQGFVSLLAQMLTVMNTRCQCYRRQSRSTPHVFTTDHRPAGLLKQSLTGEPSRTSAPIRSANAAPPSPLLASTRGHRPIAAISLADDSPVACSYSA